MLTERREVLSVVGWVKTTPLGHQRRPSEAGSGAGHTVDADRAGDLVGHDDQRASGRAVPGGDEVDDLGSAVRARRGRVKSRLLRYCTISGAVGSLEVDDDEAADPLEADEAVASGR